MKREYEEGKNTTFSQRKTPVYFLNIKNDKRVAKRSLLYSTSLGHDSLRILSSPVSETLSINYQRKTMKSASFLIQIKLIKIISTPTEIGLIKQVRLTKHFILFRGGNGR